MGRVLHTEVSLRIKIISKRLCDLNEVKKTMKILTTLSKRFFSTMKISDCLVCILRPILLMGSICGISAMKFRCPHYGKTPGQTVEFSKFTPLLLFSAVFFLPIILNFILCIYNLYEYIFRTEKVTALRLVRDIFITIVAFAWSIPGTVKYRQKLIELNGFALLVKRGKDFGILW